MFIYKYILTLTCTYSVVLNAEAISCLGSIRVERHKEVVTAGGYVTWQGASTERPQHCRRIICSIIHFENIIVASHIELEECQLNFLQMNQSKYMVPHWCSFRGLSFEYTTTEHTVLASYGTSVHCVTCKSTAKLSHKT